MRDFYVYLCSREGGTMSNFYLLSDNYMEYAHGKRTHAITDTDFTNELFLLGVWDNDALPPTTVNAYSYFEVHESDAVYGDPIKVSTNRKYKDTIFRMLFKEKYV